MFVDFAKISSRSVPPAIYIITLSAPLTQPTSRRGRGKKRLPETTQDSAILDVDKMAKRRKLELEVQMVVNTDPAAGGHHDDPSTAAESMSDNRGNCGDEACTEEIVSRALEPFAAIVCVFLQFERQSNVQAAVQAFFNLMAADLDAHSLHYNVELTVSNTTPEAIYAVQAPINNIIGALKPVSASEAPRVVFIETLATPTGHLAYRPSKETAQSMRDCQDLGEDECCAVYVPDVKQTPLVFVPL
uniref:Neutral alpha-glucosidase AB n=1 Tax=Ganoderma boninense TaxID=34458 RepID=A0A5K1K4V7_9APHY|nr:Neutral alpha-glucosidase AB [Ganoderma boninense]